LIKSDEQGVHDLFRGAAELSKCIHRVASIGELVGGGLAINALALSGSNSSGWQPLIAFMIVVATQCLRQYADGIKTYGERCRRTSLFAFATGARIPVPVASELKNDAPPGAIGHAERLPAQSMIMYYEPSTPPGEERMRELYAHSAYYSWRLLRSTSQVYLSISVIVLIVTLVVMYGLAMTTEPTVPRGKVLDALFSVVLGIISVRLIAMSLACARSATLSREVANKLIEEPLPTDHRLREIVYEYDLDRLGAPAPPTVLYNVMRRSLQRHWDHRRTALGPETH
jgi:hypothetical protein